MPVINGTEGPDTLSSTDQMDEIFALDGDDTVTLDDYYANTGAGPEAFHGGDGSDLFVVRGLLFSALSIITLPMIAIYIVFNKQIVEGITAGSLK